jgi:gliding motility-associated-like protein
LRKIFYFIAICNIYICNSQEIIVDDTVFSSELLVDLLLNNSCATSSNINVSSTQSIAYFNSNGSSFPIDEGIIIRSGVAINSQGSYTGNNLSSQLNSNSDVDLEDISNQTGQSVNITDTAFLEFDFIPYSSNFTFDFLFASNEYGEWQCGFSDVFAFILTDLTTGIKTNLGVIPNINSPISVKNIRDNQYNLSCNSVNKNLFSTYNVNNPSNSSLNMKGHTVVLTAAAEVIPTKQYRIKLVIGDYNDSDFDSAVFIKAGSFNTILDLGENEELCLGDQIIIDSNFTNTNDFIFEWKKNGVLIENETNPYYTVSEVGTYDLIITNLINGCLLTGQKTITELQVNEPLDLLECESELIPEFNLLLNNHTVLGLDSDLYDIIYYNSLENLNNNVPIEPSLLSSYPSLGEEIIYINYTNIENGNTCSNVLNFELKITTLNPGIPEDFTACEADLTVDIISQVSSQILNNLNPLDFSLSYFLTETDAQNNVSEIENPSNFILPLAPASITIWVRFIELDNPDCFEIISFQILIYSSPRVDLLEDVYECDSYILPELTNGKYFTEPEGNGIELFAGDIITENTTIYIYNINTEGCFNESSFSVFLATEFSIETEHCGDFIVPSYPNGVFYTSINGPDGIGTIIPTGTILSESQTIYFYVSIEDIFCLDTPYEITINSLPMVEERENVITCDNYILPTTLTGEKYFTESNGNGIEYFPGDEISSSITIYIWNKNTITNCVNESSYDIIIIDLDSFQDIDHCGEYILPSLDFGNYFTASGGNGVLLEESTVIDTSQTIYFYSEEITTLPNCTDSISFEVNINPIPAVDELNDAIYCENNLPILEPLLNGRYYTESGGNGNQLYVGDILYNSQTVYIYNSNSFCDNESSFTVEIRAIAPVDNFTDIFSCNSYTLPELNDGDYYTEANGQGLQLNAGDIIDTSQTIYIYNSFNDLEGCNNENLFNVNILKVEVDDVMDVYTCSNYELPEITNGAYFTEPFGQGSELLAGDLITTTQTIYVYKKVGERFTCYDEKSFTVSISDRPNLDMFENIEGCGNISLPVVDIPGVVIEYYRRPNRIDLIDPSEYTITELGSRVIYVYAYPSGEPSLQSVQGCYNESLFQVTVNDLLDLDINGGTLCIDSETGNVTNNVLLESGLNSNDYIVNWYLNTNLVGTGTNYIAEEAGEYTVETIKLTDEIGIDCNYKTATVIVERSSPSFELNILTEDFSDSNTVEINIVDQGIGTYEFSLDHLPFQSYPRFYNLNPGNHLITIRDTSGLCVNKTIDFLILNYPKFFTPNDDGINDTWNITDLQNDLDSNITIYDRFGKIITKIKPYEKGWDGYNSNGDKLPSSDYWFLVKYNKNNVLREFRANFSLLRR